MDDTQVPLDEDRDERIGRRSELLEEERRAGTADAAAQAQVILDESETRTLDRGAAPGTTTEHRRSEDTIDPI